MHTFWIVSILSFHGNELFKEKPISCVRPVNKCLLGKKTNFRIYLRSRDAKSGLLGISLTPHTVHSSIIPYSTLHWIFKQAVSRSHFYTKYANVPTGHRSQNGIFVFFIRTCALFDICYRIYNKLRNHRNWNISSFDRLKSSKADSTCTFGLDDINSFYTH